MVRSVPSDSDPTPRNTGLDLHNAHVVADLLNQAATAQLQSPLRHGGMLHLPRQGLLIMTGDLHDHHLNLQRILHVASLKNNPSHHLILHELIHGPNRVNGRDTSIRTLARAASLILQYPNQVHVLLGNHELAQLNGEGIVKRGINVVEAFNRGVAFIYGDLAPMIHQATGRFVRSLPLAALCPNGIFCSHSLPSARQLETFDTTVVNRVPHDADLASGGHAYQMVWGRRHTQEVADMLGQAWQANLFVIGHQPADMGYLPQGQAILVLASDHEHGVALPIDLGDTYDLAKLIDRLIPLASVVLPAVD